MSEPRPEAVIEYLLTELLREIDMPTPEEGEPMLGSMYKVYAGFRKVVDENKRMSDLLKELRQYALHSEDREGVLARGLFRAYLPEDKGALE